MTSTTLFTGSYNPSLTRLQFTPPSTLTPLSSLPIGDKASWLVPHPTNKALLYACLEVESGLIAAWEVEGDETRKVGEVAVGEYPCHAQVVNNGKALAVAAYGSGQATLLPLLPNGHFASFAPLQNVFSLPYTPSSSNPAVFNPERQEAAHAHQVVDVPKLGEVWVVDLGSDAVQRLKLTPEGGWESSGRFKMEEGGGCRHIVVSADANHLYTLNELSCTITHHTVSPFKLISTYSILPPNHSVPMPPASKPAPSGAELLFHASTNTILASTRTLVGTPVDVIASFTVAGDGSIAAHASQPFFAPRKGREFRGVGFLGEKEENLIVFGQEDGFASLFEVDDAGFWSEVEVKGLKEGGFVKKALTHVLVL